VRWLELIALYGLAPLVVACDRRLQKPAIVACLAFVYLDAPPAPHDVARMLLRAAIALLVLCAIVPPDFSTVRERPKVWAIVVLIYPLLSALPQEALFRSFFFRRYGELFSHPAVASALLFSWAHVATRNPRAMLLSLGAGALLSFTWLQSQNLWVVALEHSIYGAFIFSASIGGMFRNSARMVAKLIH
jgi:hypothetical protein